MRTKVLLTHLAISLILLASLSIVSAEQTGKTISIALGKEPDDLNPIANTGHGDFYDVIKVYSGLLKSDDNLQMAPDLAESWTVSPDGKTYTFKLKENVLWHDGTDFSAEDVKFTYDLLRDGKWISIFPVSSEFKIIDDVSVVDPNTIKFTLNEGIVSFQERFSLPILPKHILENQDLSKNDFWQKPIGTGPYIFEDWIHGEELTLTVNPNYYGEAPKRSIWKLDTHMEMEK